MQVTVELKNLTDVREVAGLTVDVIAKAIGIAPAYCSTKFTKTRPWFPDELKVYWKLLKKAPRPLTLTEQQLAELAGGNVVRRTFIRVPQEASQ
jgi:hypothetical protein